MTPHPSDHAPRYCLRRRGSSLARFCLTCSNRAKLRWKKRNLAAVRERDRKRWYKRKLVLA